MKKKKHLTLPFCKWKRYIINQSIWWWNKFTNGTKVKLKRKKKKIPWLLIRSKIQLYLSVTEIFYYASLSLELF